LFDWWFSFQSSRPTFVGSFLKICLLQKREFRGFIRHQREKKLIWHDKKTEHASSKGQRMQLTRKENP